MQPEAVGNYRAQWGEGPIWWHDLLYFVDIEGKCVVAFSPETSSEKVLPIGQRVGTVVPRAMPDERGNLVCAGDFGFFFLDEISGKTSQIVDPEETMPEQRFNDGKCSPDGFFFAGSINFEKKPTASLYRLGHDLRAEKVFSPVTNSNGIAWSPNGCEVFYIDTPRKNVLKFRYEAGMLCSPEIAFSTETINGSPDGLAIDVQGNLWIAFCHGSCVICFSPDGKILHKIELPCRETTAVAFGGTTLSDLYITTGIPSSAPEEPLAGRLFVVKNIGVSGLKSFAFKG